MAELRHPIGKFAWPEEITEDDRRRYVEDIAAAPAKVRAAVAGLSDEQLDTPYREGGWAVRQLVHHLADSHLNAYARVRLALTEQEPTIKTYEQELWANLADAKTAPVEVSLNMLDGLHYRWVVLMRSLQPADFARTFRHPELGLVTVEKLLSLYAWHGRHHTAHIAGLRERMGWR